MSSKDFRLCERGKVWMVQPSFSGMKLLVWAVYWMGLKIVAGFGMGINITSTRAGTSTTTSTSDREG